MINKRITSYYTNPLNRCVSFSASANPPLSTEVYMALPFGEDKAITAAEIAYILFKVDVKDVEKCLLKMIANGKIKTYYQSGKSFYYRGRV
jgi:hypothetical protein